MKSETLVTVIFTLGGRGYVSGKLMGFRVRWPGNSPSLEALGPWATKLLPLYLSLPTCQLVLDTAGFHEIILRKYSKELLIHKETLSVHLVFINYYFLQKRIKQRPES